MDPRQKLPDATHPITITPTGKRVVVEFRGVVIADTAEALTLQESTYPAVQYLPVGAVDPAFLHPSDHHTYCPYKGEADYFHLGRDGEEKDAVWIYRTPHDAVAAIKDHVAFYPDRVSYTIE
ncbi:DUF427 domain-containing protein [Pseudonocardia thermophila]|jgi:Uncharacterized protein conserved in bacteria|uniref:DUF427 domain-containing protein n=1 Tax=Pseudonocardia thermophila TaxID=1848 RepID=UPI00248DED4E|nr:DUF427 domain-containing protein [Pseudonocardia thermophila]